MGCFKRVNASILNQAFHVAHKSIDSALDLWLNVGVWLFDRRDYALERHRRCEMRTIEYNDLTINVDDEGYLLK
jgi:hypothetical protein